MSALKVHRLDAEQQADQIHGLDSPLRSASSWPLAFAQMRNLVAAEIRQGDADVDFWLEQLESLSEAEVMYAKKVADLDNDILKLDIRRRAALVEIANSLLTQSNLAGFLRRDDPDGYLKW